MDAQEQYGPTVPFQKITAGMKGTPKADFHGGESAAGLQNSCQVCSGSKSNVLKNVILNVN